MPASVQKRNSRRPTLTGFGALTAPETIQECSVCLVIPAFLAASAVL